MDTTAKIGMLTHLARRLNELPAPDLSPSELEAVLRWEFIPKSCEDIYNYALSANMFANLVNELDPKDLDNKTKKLVSSTIKLITVNCSGDNRYSMLFAGMAGIAMANFTYYYSSNTWLSTVASWIPSIVMTLCFSKIADANDVEDLSRAGALLQEFFSSFKRSTTEILIFEHGVPAVRYIWGTVKAHPWWTLTATIISPFLYGLYMEPQIKEIWIDLRLRLFFFWLALLGWIELGGKQGIMNILWCIGWLAEISRINLMLTMLAHVALRHPRPKITDQFVYLTNFQHDHRIRLLRLNRRLPFIDLETELIEVDDELLHNQQFDAISHSWGDGEKSETINVNGCQFLVTRSVYDILQRSSSNFRPRTIWIDTICINQEDDQEKVSQIQKMRSIYDHARMVQIFLSDSPNAWLALHFMHILLLLYGGPKDDFTGSMIGMLLRKDSDTWLRAQIDAFLELLSNPWFERAWIIQEFVVAREVTVNYGGYTFDWKKLTLLAEMIEDEEAPEAAQFLMGGGDNISGANIKKWIKRPILLDEWKRKLLYERYITLPQVLSSFRECKASNWQDKIFALIGFTDPTEELTAIIDYKLPKDKILLTLARHFLKYGGLMRTFPFAGLGTLPTQSTNLPTWVADWTIAHPLEPIALAKYLQYDASGTKYAHIKPGSSDREIVVAGIIFDKIDKISEVDLDFNPDAGTIRSDTKRINEALEYFNSAIELAMTYAKDPYNPIRSINQPLEEAISRTMIGDATKKSRPAAKDYKDLISRFVDHGHFISDALELRHFKWEDIHPLPWGRGAYEHEPWRERDVRKLMQQIENVRWICGGRSFCVTEKGFIGMVPRKTRSGDVVCLLDGSPVPTILRKDSSSDSYRLVGEAYVHGIMDGEGKSRDILRQDFIVK